MGRGRRENQMNLLNSGIGYVLFRENVFKDTYVDKTMMVDTFYQYTKRLNKYVCVTRPRRFGKSVAANMIAAFFDKSTGEKSKALFEKCRIGTIKSDQEETFAAAPQGPETEKLCWPIQGSLNVIRINMIDLLTESVQSCEAFLSKLDAQLREDLRQQYPQMNFSGEKELTDLLRQTKESFAFVIDEWDAVFEMPFMTEKDKEKYILFLKALFKDKAYVHFVYMTGILPIAKYTSGSPLNMFHEFSSFQDAQFYPFFGLTLEEIRKLMEKKDFIRPSLSDLTFWYDGYIRSSDGVHIYNPESVSRALIDEQCGDYWTGTGPMNEIEDLIRNNVQDLREDVIRMTGGETLSVKLSGFSVEKGNVSTRDEILSAMVVYGFLSYYDEQLCIPNHELLKKFQRALISHELGLRQTLAESQHLLNATLQQNDKEIARLIESLHTEKIPFFEYNDENSLACVVTMGYLAALDKYRVVREDKAGKGYADFTFEPRNRRDVPIILELKYNRSANNALKCIREKDYIARFRDYPSVLLVGINYSEKTKKHTCKTEMGKPSDFLQ